MEPPPRFPHSIKSPGKACPELPTVRPLPTSSPVLSPSFTTLVSSPIDPLICGGFFTGKTPIAAASSLSMFAADAATAIVITAARAAFSSLSMFATGAPAGHEHRDTEDSFVSFLYGAVALLLMASVCIKLVLQCYMCSIPTSSALRSANDFAGAEHGIKEGKAKTSAAWVAATAAPHHATGNRDLLSGFIIEHDDLFVHAVDGISRKVLARGAVIMGSVVLPDVWYVPGLTENLVSVSQLVELDYNVGFSYGECCISNTDAKVVGKGHLQKGGLYVLDFLKVSLAI